ncbi:hypothetical protein CA983_06335 [Streptomyces swartbergensis]|uniref:Phosphoribulokinase/uridine kinase domain-containing protein n=1 Tax=Streptomyces swartbergensis TaxID=487165 RepID=A0A243S8T7_9ACTN|nr:hypothetical protein CA983_06335 [Streptomyces swartbergensis]
MAEALAELCGAVVVHGDDFYRPMDAEERAGLDPVQGYHRYFDWQRLREEVLAPLAAGRDAGYRRYDWPTGTLAPDEIHTVSRSGIVVVEGVYAARPELTDYYDLVVYVDPRARNPCGGFVSAATTTARSTGSPAGAWPACLRVPGSGAVGHASSARSCRFRAGRRA